MKRTTRKPIAAKKTARKAPVKRTVKKTVAKKVVAKKPAVKKTAVKKTKVEPRMIEAFAEWKAGKALTQIARAFGVRRRIVKLAFRELAGGKDALEKLRVAGAGCHVAFGGKRPEKGVKVAAVVIDDSKVPHVPYVKHTKMAGWTWKRVPLSKGEYLLVSIAPNGKEYVRAKTTERADLILDHKKDGWDYTALGVMRMRLYETSSAARKARKQQRLVTKGEKLLKVRAKVRKVRRVAKRAAKGGK